MTIDNERKSSGMTTEQAETFIEEREFEVSVTVTFTTRVCFSPMPRSRPITTEDALDNFYGQGLSDVMDSGEYVVDVDTKSIQIVDVFSAVEG